MNQHLLSSVGRLPYSSRLILASLRDHPMGGRELLAFLAETRRWLEPGALWRALRHLERAGLISPLEPDGSSQQTRRYDVTAGGRSVLSQQENASFGEPERTDLRLSHGAVSGRNLLLIRWIVRLYPKAWRERYEQEMLELLGAHETTFWTWLDLLFNAITARLDPAYRHSAPLEMLPHIKRVQRRILAAFLLPLLSVLFYLNLFNPLGGINGDYWLRNERYPILALTHELGRLGMMVTLYAALLICIGLAALGMRQYGQAGDASFHRLLLTLMGLLSVMLVVFTFFPPLPSGEVARTLFVSCLLALSLLLLGWVVVRRAAFGRGLLYLLPWLGINLGLLTLVLGSLLVLPPEESFPFYLTIALLCVLSTPLSFALAMTILRLDTQARAILLTLVTVETLGMVTVQTMMGMRLLALQFLELRTIWTPDFLMFLILNVLATMLAVICLLPRWRQAPPTGVGEEVVVTTLL